MRKNIERSLLVFEEICDLPEAERERRLAEVAAEDGELRHEVGQLFQGQLFQLVYDRLHAQASRYLQKERAGHTLQTTALLNEAWLRLSGQERTHVDDQEHFLAVAAQAMQRILIEHSRSRHRLKRGGDRAKLELADDTADEAPNDVDLISVREALERLRERSPRLAQMVELRFFGGLTREEIVRIQGIDRATVGRDWKAARDHLRVLLEGRESPRT